MWAGTFQRSGEELVDVDVDVDVDLLAASRLGTRNGRLHKTLGLDSDDATDPDVEIDEDGKDDSL